jgi:hypothetical protein
MSMLIRFLQTTPAETSDSPFQPGQLIRVEEPSPYLLALVDGVHAELVPEDVTERAVEPEARQPEPAKLKGRRRDQP